MATAPTTKSTGGLLPMPGSAPQKARTSNPPSKAAAPRLKLLVRRLPPGLTQAEFEAAVGEDWKAGGGKVDWFQYKEGKVSKDPAKPSRPSRAYLRVTSQSHIGDLSEKVRQTSFQDARNTGHDPAVLGPPTLEFAPYARVPGSRVRKDARQGTIDQDAEFIAFLESLTNPPPKPPVPTAESADGGEKKEDKVITTPLVQFIKDKKANKAKETSSPAKSRQGRESKETKQEKVQAKKLLSRSDKDGGNAAEKQSKVEKASKDAVKAANNASKQATAATTSKAASKSATATASNEKPTASPTPEKKRERGNASAAAKILQRDLGLAPAGSGRRRGGKSASTAESTPPKDGSSKEPLSGPSGDKGKRPSTPKPQPKEILASPKQTASSKSATPTPPTEPAAARQAATNNNSNLPTGPAAGTTSKPSKSNKGKAPNQAPTPTATQAFLKHANPSQGVTEALLESTFSTFGKVTKVEIDKKKGFGYVDFEQPEGLQKAMQSSPVKVAQSQVVVLERKPGSVVAAARGGGGGRKNPPSQGNKGGGGGGNGGGAAAAVGGQGGNTARPASGNRGSRGGRSRNKGGGGSKDEATKATGGQAPAEKKTGPS